MCKCNTVTRDDIPFAIWSGLRPDTPHGVAKLATLSDGTVFEPVNSFQKNQKTLARLQRQLSRKVKFSNNGQKQKRKIQRLHSCIANIRRDYLHKVTTAVSKNHAMIVIEDLKVSNMSKSAAGTVSQPGRNVRANHRRDGRCRAGVPSGADHAGAACGRGP